MNHVAQRPAPPSGARLLLRVLVLLAFTAVIDCANAGLPESREPSPIASGGTTPVLLNVQCTVDRQPRPAFPTVPLVQFGLASFDTFGEFSPILMSPTLSGEPGRQGWVCFRLQPGSYYLRVYGPAAGPQSGQIPASIWRMVVPDGPGPVYAGTLVLAGRSLGRSLLVIETIEPGGHGSATLRDDTPLAEQLAAGLPDAGGQLRTVLLQPWKTGDPMIFRTPQSWGRP